MSLSDSAVILAGQIVSLIYLKIFVRTHQILDYLCEHKKR